MSIPGVALDGLEPTDVERGRRGREVLLVGLGERVGVAAREPRAAVLAVLGDGCGDEVVAPRPGRVGEHPLEVAGVDVGDLGAEGRVHDEVDPRGRRLTHLDVELDALALEAVEQDLREPLADGGVVALAGQVAQHRDVAAVGLAADEDPQLAAADGLQHALGDLGELLGRGVEDLVARVGLEGVHQALAGVAARLDADPRQHLGRLLAQQRDARDGLGVRRARQQAEEPALAADLAVLVEGLHADVVEVGRPVHGGPGVGLRQHQQGLLAGLGLGGVRQLGERLGLLLVGPQDAEAGAGDGAQDLVVAVALEAVLAVAQEREVVVGQPLQEGATQVDLPGIERRR